MDKEQKSLMVQKVDKSLLNAIYSCRDANKLFDLARHYGRFHWFNLTDRWSHTDLENYIFNLIEPRLPQFTPAKNRTTVTHVLSEGYDTGGHTPLCVNLIKEQKAHGDDVELIITRSATQSIIDELRNAQVPIKSTPATGVAQMLQLAQAFMQSKAVVLHINPDDIIACLATMIAERSGIPCYFVNHANIHFSYGPSQCSAILEITASSWLSSQKYRQPKAQSFLGIPASDIDVEALKKSETFETGIKDPYFISVGTPLKYRFGSSNDFPKLIEFLCGEMKQKLLLIGPGEHAALANLSADARKNLIVKGMVPREQTLALMANCKAYIDSFPEGGGTSVVNAMRLGLPIFGYRISEGMYGDEFLSQSLSDLQESLSHFIAYGADKQRLSDRVSFINSTMSVRACRERLLASIQGKNVPIPYDYSQFKMNLSYHHDQWKKNGELFIPPIISINN
ncbi:hypothetical protein [Thalassospira xiamenensis]|uniref:hypothetical protein n=1 Tax=Thalassospira xiamenensis TaxID=220697 RepID=UPI000DED9484|nr:hypothetical protein [Thalassospira xiamenensis]